MSTRASIFPLPQAVSTINGRAGSRRAAIAASTAALLRHRLAKVTPAWAMRHALGTLDTLSDRPYGRPQWRAYRARHADACEGADEGLAARVRRLVPRAPG